MSSQQSGEGVRKTRGRAFIIAFIVILLAVSGVSLSTNLSRLASSRESNKTESGQRAETLTISSGSAVHSFTIEVMRNDADRARGLMFRQSMPANHGMLFDFERDQMVGMWMKNTHIPLDMVFVHKDGRIHRIEANTEPQSERVISSGVPVRAVLELNAGTAARLGLKAGDTLSHPMFK